jgi:GT2 family glycosyltransferase
MDLLEINAVVEKARRVLGVRNSENPVAPYWLVGCCLFLKRRVYIETRGFDPDFFLYHEEKEWFYNRVFGRGYKIEICSDIKLVHLRGASQTTQSRNSQRLLSSFLFYYKLGPASFLVAWMMSLFNVVTRAMCVPFVPSFFWQNLKIIREESLLLTQASSDILSYPRDYAGRAAPLMTRSNQRRYSWSEMSQFMISTL